jgi:hypothetical protein
MAKKERRNKKWGSAIILKTGDDWLRIYTQFNPRYINALKDALEPDVRQWDSENKCWLIHESVIGELEPILNQFFEKVVRGKLDN